MLIGDAHNHNDKDKRTFMDYQHGQINELGRWMDSVTN